MRWDGDDDDEWYRDDDDRDELEDALKDCGQVPGGGCVNAGTEYCGFECPYHDIDLFSDDESV